MGYLIALWLYLVGSALIFVITTYDDDPVWQRWMAILFWPLIFPFAMIFGRNK